MLAQTFLSALALSAVSVSAIKVTYPSDRDTWSTSGMQEVKWDSVETDPKSFAMVLVNQDSSFLSGTATLNENVTTSTNSAMVSFPNGNFPAGTRFQVNFIRTISQDTSILAQSGYFNITQSAAASSSSSSSAASSSAASTASMSSMVKASTTAAGAQASGTGAAATATATDPSASGGVVNIPNSSASQSAAPNGNTSGALSTLASPAALLSAVFGLVGAALF